MLIHSITLWYLPAEAWAHSGFISHLESGTFFKEGNAGFLQALAKGVHTILMKSITGQTKQEKRGAIAAMEEASATGFAR